MKPGTSPAAVKAAPSVDCRHLLAVLRREGLYGEAARDGLPRWRVSPEPFWITPDEALWLRNLGPQLLAFYRSLNRLYYHSVRTPRLGWVHRYLDQGKPQAILDYGLMRRVRERVPDLIRPDLFFTSAGVIASELDAVPGGFGLTAALQQIYSDMGYAILGDRRGVVEGFGTMAAAGAPNPPRVAIVVSDESADYRPEMGWLARALTAAGTPTWAVRPSEMVFTEHGLLTMTSQGEQAIDVLYRFFELFDLKNIPKVELLLYAAKKELVRMTPPGKAFLEEKSAMALWHHPALERWWRDDLGPTTHQALTRLFPRTWILDPADVPPHAVIPGLTIGGEPLGSWRDLARATQRERRLVIKPSGFSARAWGSRGVIIGHDQPAREWEANLDAALHAFSATPHILQEFHAARRQEVAYFDEPSGELCRFEGRARLCPYYFVAGDDVMLGGALATVCGLEKKLIHGMADAVMVPCAVRDPHPA